MSNNRVKSLVLSTLLCTTLTGCKNDSNNENINSTTRAYVTKSSIENINIPYEFQKQLPKEVLINKENLLKLTSLELEVGIGCTPMDLMWLNSCINLRRLKLVIPTSSCLSLLEGLPKLEELEIVDKKNNLRNFLYDADLNFIKDSTNLKRLIIGNFNIENDFIESLTQLRELYLRSNNGGIVTNYSFNYKEMGFLDRIVINQPSSVAIHMNSIELSYLLENGVRIMTEKDGKLVDVSPELLSIDGKIDSLLSNVDIRSLNNDFEKIVETINFVVENYYYDIEPEDDTTPYVIFDEYYSDGFLSKALEEKGIICGNYAALTAAILDRMGIKNVIIFENRHAYNLISLNNQFYRLDSTAIDAYVSSGVYDLGAISKIMMEEELAMWPLLVVEKDSKKIDYLEHNSKEIEEPLDKDRILKEALVTLLIFSLRLTQVKIGLRRENKKLEKRVVKVLNR